MPTIYDVTGEYRRRLLAGDAAAGATMIQAYAEAYRDIEARLTALEQAVRDAGGAITNTQLVRLAQYENLLDVWGQSAELLARQNADLIAAEQAKAMQTAAAAARAQLAALTPEGWVQVFQPAPEDALRALAGAAGDGSPLKDLLDQHGAESRQNVVQTLQRGVAGGTWAVDLAKRVRDAWGQPLTRALALARTETMRAYREGARAQYLANDDVVASYEWLSAHSVKTCPACLALDGRVFDLREPMPAHVNCRCTVVPILRNRARPARQTGAEWFAKQDEATQERILGRKGYEAFQNGAKLSDFAQPRHDHKWGTQYIAAVPKGFTAPKPVPQPPPAPPKPKQDANGRFNDPADVIGATRDEYAKWLAARPSALRERFANDPAAGRLRWLSSQGTGQRTARAGDLVYDPAAKYADMAPKTGELAAAKKKLQDGLDSLPAFAPEVKAALKANRTRVEVVDDAAWLAQKGERYRASYTPRGVGSLNLADTDSIGVHVHEYAHHIERTLGISERNAAWVRGRASGPEKNLRDLTGQNYRDDETALPDKFLDPYVGKVYTRPGGDVYATEVLSMGVQALFENPRAFARDHEEHFWLTVGALLGF